MANRTMQRICGDVAPEAVSGSWSPVRCSREVNRRGVHSGDHKAHRTILRVGRVNFHWKQAAHVERSTPPPEIELPGEPEPWVGKVARRLAP